MSKRQYVSVRYKSSGTRAYTFHNDGEPLAIGDKVKVPDARGGTEPVTVEVVDIWDRVPEFKTKGIIGKADLL